MITTGTPTLRAPGYQIESPEDRHRRLREVIQNDGADKWPILSGTWAELRRAMADGETRTGYEWAGLLPDAFAHVVKDLLYLAWKQGILSSVYVNRSVEEAPDLFVVRKFRAYRLAPEGTA